MIRMQPTLTAALVLSSGLALCACSSGGGGGPGQTSGAFLDSAVQGLGFSSGALSGVTDAAGTFQSEGGAAVAFSIGDIDLGDAAAQAQVTPVDLVPGALDELNPTVTNLARLLQTLDSNQDPDDGITIDPSVSAAAVGQTLDFHVSILAFEGPAQAVIDVITAGLPGGPRTLISASLAQQHLASTLLATQAGRYEGTFAGDDSGDFAVYIDRAGTLFGYADSISEGVLGLSGSSDSGGGFLAGVVSSSATFTGSIADNGTLSGTWQLAPESGTFIGSRVSGVDAVIDLDLIALRAGTYTGTYVTPFETGPITLILDSEGNFSAPPPDDQAAMTVVSAGAGVITFAGLSTEGDAATGTIDANGDMSGSFENPLEGGSGTFTATFVP